MRAHMQARALVFFGVLNLICVENHCIFMYCEGYFMIYEKMKILWHYGGICCHFVVARKFVYATDPGSYTTSSLPAGSVFLAGQVKG
jgi:hypothetical protein